MAAAWTRNKGLALAALAPVVILLAWVWAESTPRPVVISTEPRVLVLASAVASPEDTGVYLENPWPARLRAFLHLRLGLKKVALPQDVALLGHGLRSNTEIRVNVLAVKVKMPDEILENNRLEVQIGSDIRIKNRRIIHLAGGAQQAILFFDIPATIPLTNRYSLHLIPRETLPPMALPQNEPEGETPPPNDPGGETASQ
jgi:hypothetical protein